MADASAGVAYVHLVTQRSHQNEPLPIHILPALPEHSMPKYSMDEGEALARKKTAGSKRSHQVGARVKAFFRRDSSLELPRQTRNGSYPGSYSTLVIDDDGSARKSRDDRGKKSTDEAIVFEEEVNPDPPVELEANKLDPADLSKIPIPDGSHENNNLTALGLSAPRPPTPPRARHPKTEPILSPQTVHEFDQRRSEDQHSLCLPQREPPPISHLEQRHLSPFGSPVFGPKSPRRSMSRASTYRPFSLQIDRDRPRQDQADDQTRPSLDFDSSIVTLTENNPPTRQSPPLSPTTHNYPSASSASLTYHTPKGPKPPSRNPTPSSIDKTPSRSRFSNLNNLFSSSPPAPPPPSACAAQPVAYEAAHTCPLTHEIQTLQTQNSALKSCLETNLASQSTLKNRLTSSLSRIETLSARLTHAQSQSSSATKRADALAAQLSRLNTENSNLRVDLATWQRRHEEVELLLMKEVARSKSLKGSLEERDYEMEGYRLRVEVLEGKVRSLKGERDLLGRENEGLWGLLDFEAGGGSLGEENNNLMKKDACRRRERDKSVGASGSKYQDRYERERERERGRGYLDGDAYEPEHDHLSLGRTKSRDEYERHGQRDEIEYGHGLDTLRHQVEYTPPPLQLAGIQGQRHGGRGQGESPDENGYSSPVSGLFAGDQNVTGPETETANDPSMSFEEMIRGLRGAGSDDDDHDDGVGLLRLELRDEQHVLEHGSDVDGKQLELDGAEGLYSGRGEEQAAGGHGVEACEHERN